jgi:predicted membrane metal-binding protein
LLLLGVRLVGKRFAPPLAIAGILLYTFLVGAAAAVSRAAAMGIIWVLAIWSGCLSLTSNSLLASVLILTLINPLDPVGRGLLTFKLSFMVTLASVEMLAPGSASWQMGPALSVPIHGVSGDAFVHRMGLLGVSIRAGAIENEGQVQIYPFKMR